MVYPSARWMIARSSSLEADVSSVTRSSGGRGSRPSNLRIVLRIAMLERSAVLRPEVVSASPEVSGMRGGFAQPIPAEWLGLRPQASLAPQVPRGLPQQGTLEDPCEGQGQRDIEGQLGDHM